MDGNCKLNRWRMLVLLSACLISLVRLVLAPAEAGQVVAMTTQASQQCFQATSFCLNEVFTQYWNQNGGLPVFGFPIARAQESPDLESGHEYLVQWLERNRFELHPEFAGTPYHVLLGLLGKQRLAQLGRRVEARESGPQAACLWFAETGHNVCDQGQNLGFMSYWQAHGLAHPQLSRYSRSLQLFGLPLTSPKLERNSSGDYVLTQWFERARFEWHPNNPSLKVLLGRLGSEIYESSPGEPLPPTPTARATATPEPGVPSATRNPTRTTPPSATRTATPTRTPLATQLPTTTPIRTATPTRLPAPTATVVPTPSPWPYPLPRP